MESICITIVDSDIDSDIDIDGMFDSITGHKHDCDYQKTPNKPINGIGPICSGKNKKCGLPISPQSCLNIIDGVPIGKCRKHWKKTCKKSNWNHTLSKCANKKCDLKEINLECRYKINKLNIKKELNLPNQNKYNHIFIPIKKNPKIKTDDNISNLLKRKSEDTVNYSNKKQKITLLDTESEGEIIDI